MPRVKCPYCGAEFDVPEGFRLAVCPYCGTTVEAATGSRAETFLYPVRLSEQEAYQLAVLRASQLPGAPRGIEEESSYVRGDLHLVPLYVCKARALVEGCEGAVEEREDVWPAAPRALPGLAGYRFPAAGREPYDPSRVKGARFHQVAESHEAGCSRLESRVSTRALGEAALAKCSGRLVSESHLIGVAHYPFWVVRYTHPKSSRELRAVVDAVDANVVYLEYPIPLERRALLLAGAAASLGAGVAAAALIAAATSPQAVIGAVAAIAPAAPFLRRVASRLGRYTWRPPRVEKTVIARA